VYLLDPRFTRFNVSGNIWCNVYTIRYTYISLQTVIDAHGVDAHGVGANSAQPHGLG